MDKDIFRSYVLVVATLFIDSVGYSMVLPLLPQLSKHYGTSSFIYGIMVSSYGVSQFISNIKPFSTRLNYIWKNE